MCNVKSPCNARHCYLCGKGSKHWFHLPPSYKLGRPKHRRSAIKAYFGF